MGKNILCYHCRHHMEPGKGIYLSRAKTETDGNTGVWLKVHSDGEAFLKRRRLVEIQPDHLTVSQRTWNAIKRCFCCSVKQFQINQSTCLLRNSEHSDFVLLLFACVCAAWPNTRASAWVWQSVFCGRPVLRYFEETESLFNICEYLSAGSHIWKYSFHWTTVWIKWVCYCDCVNIYNLCSSV